MRSKRPRGLEGYTPDWREKLGEPTARRRRAPGGRRPARPSRGGLARTAAAPGARAGRGPGRVALLFAAAEIALVAWLLAGPVLAVRYVEVRGTEHLTAGQVVKAAGLEHPGSLLAVDPRSIRAGLDRLAWVRTASVDTRLPGTVVITVGEWAPVAAYRAGTSGRAVFLNDQGAVVGAAFGSAAPFTIQGPAGPEPKVGDRPLDPRLVVAMDDIQRALPGTVGLSVSGYTVDSAGNVGLVTNRGWPVQFGRILTPEQFQGLQQQLAALKSVSACVDFRTAPIQYVNVVNPSAPDVRYKTGGPRPCRP